MIAFALILVLLAVSFLLHTTAIKFGAKWAKVPGVTFRRAVVIMLVQVVVSFVLSAVVGWFFSRVELPPWGEVSVPFGIVAVSDFLTLAILLRTSVWRGILVWLPRLGATAAMLAFLFLVVKSFVVEGFIQPSHAMAPTLLGPHIRGNCSRCGGPATALYNRETLPHGDPLGMCSACQQPVEKMVGGEILTVSADRFAVCKFLQPARWTGGGC